MRRVSKLEKKISELTVLISYLEQTPVGLRVKCRRCVQLFKTIAMRYCFRCETPLDDICYKAHNCGFEFDLL